MARDWDGAVGAFRFESQQGPKKKKITHQKKKKENFLILMRGILLLDIVVEGASYPLFYKYG